MSTPFLPPAQPGEPSPVTFLDLTKARKYRCWGEVPKALKERMVYKGCLSDGTTNSLVWFREWSTDEAVLLLQDVLIDTSERFSGEVSRQSLTFQPQILLAGRYSLMASLFLHKEGEGSSNG